MPVCIHPFEASPRGALARYALSPLVGNLFDTGLAASLLVMGGVLERHPRLRFVLYHGGGTFPALIARLEKGYELIAETRAAAPKPPSAYLDHFWFDTVDLRRGLARLPRRAIRRRAHRARQRLSAAARPARSGGRGARARAGSRESEAAMLGGNACGLLGLPRGAEAAA